MADNSSNGANTPPSLQVKDVETTVNSKEMDSKVSDVLFPDDSDDDGDIFKEKKRTDSMLVATSGEFEPQSSDRDNTVSYSRRSEKNGKEEASKKGTDEEDEDIERTFLTFKEQNPLAPAKEGAAVLDTTSLEKSKRKKSSEIPLEEADLIEIIVSDARKVGDGMNAYVAYKVSTKTNSKLFVRQELSVNRRFSDFLGLYEKLVSSHQHLGRIVPCPPEKDMIGMTRIKMSKEETGSMDFVERRRASLERFLMKIARHPQLSRDQSFIEFLQVEGELPKVSGVSILSGAGIAKLIGKVGDSINKMTYTLPESDQWFEDRNEQLEILEKCLQELHASSEALVMQRKDLAQCTGLISRAVANLGSTEEDLPLSRILSNLSDNFGKIEKVHYDQADLDFYSFSELFKDHLQMLNSIGAVLGERVKAHKHCKDAEALLQKKKDLRNKLENQKKTDKLEFVSIEISEAEEKVSEGEKKFEEISETIKKEVEMLERMLVREYTNTFINYLQSMANLQAELRDVWQSVLNEVEPSAK